MKKSKLPLVSIVIPTYNRAEILKKTVEKFFHQTYQKIEIIVVDDGSSDNTKDIIKVLRKKYLKLKIEYIYQKKRGPSAARNKGILKSKGEIILIVNDDSLPTNDLVKEHVEWHKKFERENYGVLGFFTWSPEIKITPYMKWLESKGPQFSYGKIKGNKAEWYQFWTCNISLKKSFLMKNGLFDENFPFAAWEDIELGYRLGMSGLKLLYNANAICYHYHPTTIFSTFKRMKIHGFSVGILNDKVNSSLLPPLASLQTAKKLEIIDRIFIGKILETIMIKIAVFFENKIQFGLLYDLLLLHFRIVGRREYLNKYGR